MRYMITLLCALLLCGCVPVSNTDHAIFAVAQAAEATPVPAVDELTDTFLSTWKDELNVDVSAYLPETFFNAESPWQIFGTTMDERLWLPKMEAEVQQQLDSSVERAWFAFSDIEGMPFLRIEKTSIVAPSWQLIYALIQRCKSADEANALIENAMMLNATAELTQSALTLNIASEPLSYREALRLPDNDETAYWSRCFSYSYLYTVFGADASEVDYELPPAEGNLESGIRWPLGSYTRLRKTWFANRDNGRRKHTGTDIWAAADTEIYSCTNGVVTYVGFGNGTGFAVIITDEYGYQYHYYHMIRLSDFLSVGDNVLAGSLIGHVGNSGNSDLDHLHLTIVAPDGKYINPYPYLEAVKPEKNE